MSTPGKPLRFIGRAGDELRDFPGDARTAAGRELRRVQGGEQPLDFKPMQTVGPGASEIRVRTTENGVVQHRVIYVARFPEAIYVLHAFQKTTRKTAPHHVELARVRYRQMLSKREEGRGGR